MLKIGDKAPAFRLKNDAGNDVSLSDYHGKRVVLFFYPKANTPVERPKRPSFATQKNNSTSLA